MKKIILILTISILGQVSTSFAQNRNSIDDLQSLELRVDEKTIKVNVHLPNYRIGGGTPATREIIDCFLLDILDSDNETTLSLKEKISQEIKVTQGFFDNNQTELIPTRKGNNIVFKIFLQVFILIFNQFQSCEIFPYTKL